MEDEHNLIEAARSGSAEAFCTLVALHQARVRGYVGRYVRHPDLVDDLAQESFLSAFRRLETFRGEVPLAIWLLGIARNAVLEHLRREDRRRAREARSLEASLTRWRADRVERDTEAKADREREVSALRHCLEELPENSARLVAEYYYRARSAVQIAQDLRHKEGTVRMTLLRIRQALRECVRRKLASGGSL